MFTPCIAGNWLVCHSFLIISQSSQQSAEVIHILFLAAQLVAFHLPRALLLCIHIYMLKAWRLPCHFWERGAELLRDWLKQVLFFYRYLLRINCSTEIAAMVVCERVFRRELLKVFFFLFLFLQFNCCKIECNLIEIFIFMFRPLPYLQLLNGHTRMASLFTRG